MTPNQSPGPAPRTERENCRRLVLWIAQQGRSKLSGPPPDAYERKHHDQLVNIYPPADDLTLERVLVADQVDMLGKQPMFVHAAPVKRGSPILLPVLSVKWNFSGAAAELALRLALFGAAGTLQRQVVGWRFETPGKGGMHDYYHAQPIDAFTKNDPRWRLQVPGALNTSLPAFPLDAESPSALIVAMLIALYGGAYVAGQRTGNPFFRASLDAMPAMASARRAAPGGAASGTSS